MIHLLLLLSLLLSFNFSFAGDIFAVPEEISKLSTKRIKDLAISEKPGNVAAKFQLGELASNPGMTKTKKLEAQKWWYEAAKKGHLGAIERLISSPKGLILDMKPADDSAYQKFIKKNTALFKMAENKEGKAGGALFSIGNLYDQGDEDLEPHRSYAIKFWSLSAKQCYPKAIETIYNLNLEAITTKK